MFSRSWNNGGDMAIAGRYHLKQRTLVETHSGFSLPPRHQSPAKASCWLNL